MIETTRCITVPESAETAFPFKLHVVLDEADKQGFRDVISWQGSNAFMIHRPKKFEESVLKEYFNQTLYSNFQKQRKLLRFFGPQNFMFSFPYCVAAFFVRFSFSSNYIFGTVTSPFISIQQILMYNVAITVEIHGFKRIPVGERFGGSYTHSLFLRGKPNMGQFMITISNAQKPKLKRSKLRRGSSAPIYQSRSRPKTTQRLVDSSGQISPLVNKEDFEPLPHNEEDAADYCRYDQRSAKKHKRNSSWSPIDYATEDSAIADWLSSTFGGTENNSNEEGQ